MNIIKKLTLATVLGITAALQAQISSQEAMEVKQQIDAMVQNQIKPLAETVNQLASSVVALEQKLSDRGSQTSSNRPGSFQDSGDDNDDLNED